MIDIPENEVWVKMVAEIVDGKILSVQTHVGEEVQLMTVVVKDEDALVVSLLCSARQLFQTALIVIVPAKNYIF